MTAELLISLVGNVVLPVVGFIAGVYITKRRYKTAERQRKNDHVFNNYMDFRKNNTTSGIDGLLRAGVAILETSDEINALADRIMNHHEHDPLERQSGVLNGVDLKTFFALAARERVNWFETDATTKFIEKHNLKGRPTHSP